MYPYQNTIPVGYRIWYIVLDEEVVGASFAALNSNCLHGSWLKPGGFVFFHLKKESPSINAVLDKTLITG
jgi:hypothetical protein